MKSNGEICEEIISEVIRAEAKHPNLPSDIVFLAYVISDQAADLRDKCEDYHYGYRPTTKDEIRKEAIQTAATCIRLLKNL